MSLTFSTSTPLQNIQFITYKNPNPVSSLVQLCYVLPRKSLNLLPKNIQKALKTKKWHPHNCEFIWAYCKYFWECHPDLPEINIEELEKLVEIEHELKSQKASTSTAISTAEKNT
jgi:hypothetical protein